jgi:hypothetical protein
MALATIKVFRIAESLTRRSVPAVLALLLAAALPLSARPPAGGFRGVPWNGSRDDFKKAIPGLTCAPIACTGFIMVGDIRTKVDIFWGGFAANVTSITLTFSKSRVSDMANVLRAKYDAPSNQHYEDGARVSEWRLPDVLIQLNHGSAADTDGIVYFEPKAQAKKAHDDSLAEKKRKEADRKRLMKDAPSAW